MLYPLTQDIYSCRYELLNQFIYPNMVIIVAILFLFHKLESTNYLHYREVLMCCVSYNWRTGYPFITLIDGFKFRHYIWWAGFYHIILNGVLCFLTLFCELCSTPKLRVLIPSFSDLDSAVLQELMYVELYMYIKFIDGFWPLHVWCIFYRCEVWNARTVLLGALWWEQH